MNELKLLEDADRRARRYVEGVNLQSVYPSLAALADLAQFDESFPDHGQPAQDTVRLLDEIGGPATVVSNGPNYL